MHYACLIMAGICCGRVVKAIRKRSPKAYNRIYMYTKQHEACNSIITKPGWLEAIPFRKKTDTQDMLEVMKTISLAFHVHIPENVTNGLGFGFGREKNEDGLCRNMLNFHLRVLAKSLGRLLWLCFARKCWLQINEFKRKKRKKK